METQNEATTVLMKARGILAKGWCQGQYRDGDRFCIYGAVNEAAGADWLLCDPTGGDFDAIGKCELVLGETLGMMGADIWQDAPGRTHAQVLDLMDRAIERSMHEQPV